MGSVGREVDGAVIGVATTAVAGVLCWTDFGATGVGREAAPAEGGLVLALALALEPTAGVAVVPSGFAVVGCRAVDGGGSLSVELSRLKVLLLSLSTGSLPAEVASGVRRWVPLACDAFGCLGGLVAVSGFGAGAARLLVSKVKLTTFSKSCKPFSPGGCSSTLQQVGHSKSERCC